MTSNYFEGYQSKETGLTGAQFTVCSRLRTVVVVGMGVRWLLLGGASGRFGGALFCQLKGREQLSKLEE